MILGSPWTILFCVLQEGHQPGVPATAAAAAATSTQREAMQVRRPEQLQPPTPDTLSPQEEAAFAALGQSNGSHRSETAAPGPQKEAAYAAQGQPVGGHHSATAAEANRQPPELTDNHLGRHLQVTPS